jgi:putative peptidoglycan lipid II flippase
LRYYLLGLVFAAIDWPLNYAFYARQDTLTPALVGVLSVVVYLAVALTLIHPLGFLGLVLADSAKHLSHAFVMLLLTRRQIGSLASVGLGQTALKSLLASGVMTAAMALLLHGITRVLGDGGLLAGLITVLIVSGVGFLVYMSLITWMRVEEVSLVRRTIQQRLGRSQLD